MLEKILVPDIGDYANVAIIEVSVKAGDTIKAEDSMITLETDKASMEIPSPKGGVIKELLVKVGDKVSQGSEILALEVTGDKSTPAAQQQNAPAAAKSPAAPAAPKPAAQPQAARSSAPISLPSQSNVYAGPGVRRYARELGVDLNKVNGSGRKDRIVTTDVQEYVQQTLQGGGGTGIQIPAAPAIDFSQYGSIEKQPLNRIQKISGAFLHRNWISIPHVTQFDEADITELEVFRKGQKDIADQKEVKLTPVVFLMKAIVAGLKQFPKFNSSLAANGEELILKKYFHIGVAVDTPNGLVVPVVRNVDQKGLFELAADLGQISKKARDGKLTAADMQGGCFTISSLGGIGGTAFTPIINAPEIAILGVSKAQMKPIYDGEQFIAKLMLQLSLSYDHAKLMARMRHDLPASW
ncbi:MAG TPA: 2-oxo acid dehydrogenase subunit E2 [Gammaproteobacteria bacterium]|nr:2-oxo acid dehydrogenase subunit E2 [Gammaproteobacteria bacterium]